MKRKEEQEGPEEEEEGEEGSRRAPADADPIIFACVRFPTPWQKQIGG